MTSLQDNFGRTINYLRLSVTDRCDFRCVYCMAENMEFVPRQQLLSIEEMTQIASAFVELGVKKIRITGGEPLIRRNILKLFKHLGELPLLEELTLTSNGSQLASYAQPLVDAGVQSINISLDSLNPQGFKQLTRTGELEQVLNGIDAGLAAGLKIKLNSVILRNRNLEQVPQLVQFAIDRQCDISFIEEMPLGLIDEHQRQLEFVSSQELKDIITKHHDLMHSSHKNTGGPSRYWAIANTNSRVGFISPHSENFCADCNRVRLTATGQLLLCLGNEHSVDLKKVIRAHPGNRDKLCQAIINSMDIKPEKHHFDLAEEPQILRFMNTTGG